MPEMFAQSSMGDYEYFINIELASLTTNTDIPIDNVIVDTGFTNDILLPINFIEILEANGFRLYDLGPDEVIFDAFGDEVSGDEVLFCIAKLKKIHEHEFSDEIITVEVLLYGTGEPLIGLHILSKWIEEFNGPAGLLSFYLEN